MTAVSVRLLVPADAAAYQALRVRGMTEHPEAFTSSALDEAARDLKWAQERPRAAPHRPHDFLLGAFQADTLVGVVGIQGRNRPKERHTATVVGMYVAPEVWGHGVARALMPALLDRVAAMPGVVQLDLTVTAGNDRAQALYGACGFTVFGVLTRAIKVGERYFDKVHMLLPMR